MTAERLEQQQKFIHKKLPKSKLFDKYGLTLVDSNDIIIQSLMGELRNIIQAFFKGGLYGKKECEHCKTTTAKQYERAHDKDHSRYAVAMAALTKLRTNDESPIKQKDFMKAFIQEHVHISLWILCKSCHIKYDKQ